MHLRTKTEITEAGDTIIRLGWLARRKYIKDMKEMRRMDDIAQMRWATEQGIQQGEKLGEQRGITIGRQQSEVAIAAKDAEIADLKRQLAAAR
jgi:hypothetical protein